MKIEISVYKFKWNKFPNLWLGIYKMAWRSTKDSRSLVPHFIMIGSDGVERKTFHRVEGDIERIEKGEGRKVAIYKSVDGIIAYVPFIEDTTPR